MTTNSPLVGHVIRKNALERYGYEGSFYTYTLAGNGVWIQAENALMSVRMQVAAGTVRGLEPLDAYFDLRGRRPPEALGLEVLGMLLKYTFEVFAAIVVGSEGYHVVRPVQIGEGSRVAYEPFKGEVLLEMHSHPGMGAFFSGTDNRDEQGFRIYGVLGRHKDGRPAVRLRVGVYGVFMPVAWREVFRSPLPDVFIDLTEQEPEEVLDVPYQ